MAPKGTKVVASNRRARHDYDILDTFECGIALKGSEVKSLRDSKVQLKDSFARVQDGEMWLGYLQEYPDYMTQGETIQELEENLRDIYKDLASGAIPCARKVAELQVP